MTTPVTLKPKCYVYVCVGCGLLADSGGSDALTCSTRCRVKAHRNGDLRRLRAEAKSLHIPPASILQAKALLTLCPHLAPAVVGGLGLGDTRAEVWAAYWARITQALGYPEQTEKDAQLAAKPPDEP
jgi:hypothetical protein